MNLDVSIKDIGDFFFVIYSYVHTFLDHFSPSPFLFPLPPLPSLPGRTYSALFSKFVEEKT
jgi:hypothetical protein